MSLHFIKSHNNLFFKTSTHYSLFVFSSIPHTNLLQIWSSSLRSAVSSWFHPNTDCGKEAVLATKDDTRGEKSSPHHPCPSSPKTAKDWHHCFIIQDPTAPAVSGDHSRWPTPTSSWMWVMGMEATASATQTWTQIQSLTSYLDPALVKSLKRDCTTKGTVCLVKHKTDGALGFAPEPSWSVIYSFSYDIYQRSTRASYIQHHIYSHREKEA